MADDDAPQVEASTETNDTLLSDPATRPETQAPALPGIPLPPRTMPEDYLHEHESVMMEAASATPDMRERLIAQRQVKQFYANKRIEQQIVGQSRAQGLNSRIGDYTKAAYEILDNDKWDYKTKAGLAKKLITQMHADPSLDYGEAKYNLQDHIESIFRMPKSREVGDGYSEMIEAIADGRITNNSQILQMEREGRLTHRGATEGFSTLKSIDKPEGVLSVTRNKFFTAFEPALNPGNTALGKQRVALAREAATLAEQEIAKKGGNPMELYNSNSKNYFFSPENIAVYAPTLQESIDYQSKLAAGTGEPVYPPPLHQRKPAGVETQTAAPAPSGDGLTPQTPVDATAMSRDQMLQTLGGKWVRLPDGSTRRVPPPKAPKVPQSQ